MRDVSPDTLTQAFADYAAKAEDPRTREVLCSLARHMHAFVKETKLSHAEWMAGLMALTRAGEELPRAADGGRRWQLHLQHHAHAALHRPL
jgi:hypothetical protein